MRSRRVLLERSIEPSLRTISIYIDAVLFA